MEKMPEWIASLEVEDLNFIKKFVTASGSLKEVADIYGVTYPTVRLRLDKLIQKIKMVDKSDGDSFITMIKNMAMDDKMDVDTAKKIISAYKSQKEEEK